LATLLPPLSSQPRPLWGGRAAAIWESVREFALAVVPRFTMVILGILPTVVLSMLPLSVLLLALPAVIPEESVITDTTPRTNRWQQLL
jgi:hypothetical protein